MKRLTEHELLIFDGATGTNLQEMAIPEAAWDGREGCNELLNVTAPEVIESLHRDFLVAGAMVLETNTFGASSVVLAEYGLEDRMAEINRAAVANARRAIGSRVERYVVGAVGPTTKLVSLGHIERDALAWALGGQVRALLEAGVDGLLFETCQDLLQIKTAVVTAFESMETVGVEVPVMVSVTIEQTGTMLVGSDIAAVCATLEPFPLFALGLNCATGPDAMESHIRYLCRQWPRRVSCMPNQGLPEVVDGRTVYRLGPAEFAARMRRFVVDYGVSVAGGCCGTTAAHVAALVSALDGVRPGDREVER